MSKSAERTSNMSMAQHGELQRRDRETTGRRQQGRGSQRGPMTGRNSHQQTRFSTGSITNNDQLSAEFGHLGGCGLILNGI